MVRLFLLTLICVTTVHGAGDRYPDTNCVYPEEAFFHNQKGGSVLDITTAPFNAKGDGKTDDTEAFIKAYDFILREQDKVGYAGTAMLNTSGLYPNKEGYAPDGPVKTTDSSFIIYVPNGEYLVSDTIIYSMRDRTPSNKRERFFRRGQWVTSASGWERLIWVRFIGQNRDKTIIRLKDNSDGFGKGSEKPVFSFGKSSFNNRKGLNVVRNLTIDIGKGNPGTVGIDFTGANKAQLRNLTIRSGDGTGDVGLLFKRPPVIGYHSDITIDGFDYGISTRVGHACAPVLEYVTLVNQRKAGVLLAEKKETDGGKGEAMLAMRYLNSQSRNPAVELSGEGCHFILIDSELNGKDESKPAIQLDHGELFLRNVVVNIYADAVSKRGKAIISGNGSIKEFVSGPVIRSKGQKESSLHLEVPIIGAPDWPQDRDQWATPFEYGAKADGRHDDTDAVQAAFNSGKPVVFLTQAKYNLTGSISVPSTVRYVDGLFRYNPDLELIVSENTSSSIRFGNLYRGSIIQNSPRTVIFDMAEATYANTERAKGGKFVVLNGSYPGNRTNKAAIDFYGWSVNNEGSGLPLVNDGATTWFFGFKCERGPVLQVKNGGYMEILGATIGVGTPDQGAIVNHESNLCLVANKSAGEWEQSAVAIEETINGKTTRFLVEQLPPRTEKNPEFPIIPLYVGRTKD